MSLLVFDISWAGLIGFRVQWGSSIGFLRILGTLIESAAFQ